MKVAFFAHYAGIYGANQSLMALVMGLRERGVKPLVFVPDNGPIVTWLREREIAFETIRYKPWMAPPRRWLRAPIRLWINRRARPLIRQQLRTFQPALIHSNSSVLGIGMKVAAEMQIPHVWHLREFAVDAFQMRPDLGWRHAQHWLEQSEAYIAVSRALKRHLLPPQVQERCTVIYNGVMYRQEMVEMKKVRQDRKHFPHREVIFLMVGRISPLKGQAQAIKAMARVQTTLPGRKLELKLVGGGSDAYVAELKRLAEKVTIGEQVEFVGYVDNPFRWYATAAAVLVCSRSEGMGRVTAEAMGAGLPVIGRDTTGTAELIEHEQTGLLYDGRIETLAAAMIRLIEEPNVRVQIARQGWEKAYAHFTIETYCSRTLELFEQIASRG